MARVKCLRLIFRTFLTVLTVLLALADSAQVCAKAENSPRQTLEEINAAIKNSDYAAFERRVDVDSILRDALDSFLRKIQEPENASQIPPMLALLLSQSLSGSQGQQAIRSLLLNETKSFVANGITSGAFAGKKPDPARQTGLLAPLFANASTGRKEIISIGEATPGDEERYAPFVVRDYGAEHDYPIVGRFAPSVDGYRLAGIENFEQIFNQIQNESQQ